MFGNICCRDKV